MGTVTDFKNGFVLYLSRLIYTSFFELAKFFFETAKLKKTRTFELVKTCYSFAGSKTMRFLSLASLGSELGRYRS